MNRRALVRLALASVGAAVGAMLGIKPRLSAGFIETWTIKGTMTLDDGEVTSCHFAPVMLRCRPIVYRCEQPLETIGLLANTPRLLQ